MESSNLIGERVTFSRFNPNYSRTMLQTITDVVEWEHREGNGWYFRLASFGHMGLDLRRPDTDRVVAVQKREAVV